MEKRWNLCRRREFDFVEVLWKVSKPVFQDRYQLLVYSLETSNEKLRTALRLADWSIGVKVTTYLERYRSAILDIVQEKNLKIESDVHLFEFFMTKEEANAKTLT